MISAGLYISIGSPSDSKGTIFRMERDKIIKFYKLALIFKLPGSIFSKVKEFSILAEPVNLWP